jgi:hypothetical protein
MDWVAYKEHEFISHSFGNWEVQDQYTSRYVAWFISGTFLLCPHMLQGTRQFFFKDMTTLQSPYLLVQSHLILAFELG